MLAIAVVGFGWWGRHVCTRLQGSTKLRVTLVVEPNEALHPEITALGLRVVAGYDTALADPAVTAVVLTSPHMVHEEQVIAAARAGKHVFCEKPLGITAESAHNSVAACRKAGVVMGIGHERRFEPAMQRLKRVIARGELGVLQHVEAAFSHNKLNHLPAGGWRTSKELSPGAGMTGMGIHLTDLLLWFFGPVDSVQAQVRDRALGWPTGDMVVAQLGFKAGMTGQLQALLNTPHFMRFHVFGTKGWIEIRNGTHPDTPGGRTDWTQAAVDGTLSHDSLDWTDAVSANLEAFAAAVEEGTPYPWTDDELIGNIALYEAIVASADSGETVRL